MHEGHRNRMREKFLRSGLDGFQDHEKLEFLLFNSIWRKNTNEIAHLLMDQFGSIAGVLDAPIDKLKQIKGVGENTAIFIRIIREMCRCYMEDKCDHDNKIVTPEDVGNIFLSKFIARDNEVVMLMLLDSKNKLLYCGAISEGNFNSADIYVRRIIELAMQYNASQAVLAHNHPSGVALPSTEDLVSTANVLKTLQLVGIRLLDHIIVADNDYVSLAQSKLGEQIF